MHGRPSRSTTVSPIRESSLGSTRLQLQWNWAEAEPHYRRSLELEPNNAEVHYAYGLLFLRSVRRWDEAVAEIRRAEALDPLAPAIPNALGTVLIDASRYDEAIAALNRALALDADFVPAHQSLARVYRLTGKGDRATAESRRAIELGARTGRAALAESYVVAGRHAEAKAVLNELVAESTRSRRGAFGVAMVWVALADNARALDWLERAYEEHDLNMVFLNTFPELESSAHEPALSDARAPRRHPVLTQARRRLWTTSGFPTYGGVHVARARCHPSDGLATVSPVPAVESVLVAGADVALDRGYASLR